MKNLIILLLAYFFTHFPMNAQRLQQQPYRQVNIVKSLAPATSELDSQLLLNPDRGFRNEVVVRVANIVNDGSNTEPTQGFKVRTTYYEPENPVLAQMYFYLSGYNDTRIIPDEAINVIQAHFDLARKERIKLLVRFAYQTGQDIGRWEAPQEVMMAHMQQLKPLLERNKDVIHVVQAGFLGAWGEWHSAKLKCDTITLLKGIINMAPPDKFIQVRVPEYKNILPETDPDYNRVSYHIDSVFGDEVPHWSNGGVDPGTDWWKQITRESPNFPVDGEMMWGLETLRMSRIVDGFQTIRQLSEHRYTSFSLHHNYRENDPKDKYSMRYWQETEIKPEWLDKHRIFYASGWFKNKYGQTVKRSAFDFVQHYLGYKLEAKTIRAKTNENMLEVEMDFVNYGFSACFELESGFVILDENNRVVSTNKAGTPSDWHSRSLQDYNDARLLTYTVKAKMPAPSGNATYKIAFYLKNSLGCFARLSNELEFENGYNILHTL